MSVFFSLPPPQKKSNFLFQSSIFSLRHPNHLQYQQTIHRTPNALKTNTPSFSPRALWIETEKKLPPPTPTPSPPFPSSIITAPSQVSPKPGLWALVRGSHSLHCCRQGRVIPLAPLKPQCHAECHATSHSSRLRWHVDPAFWRVPSQNGDVSWRLHALAVTSGQRQVCAGGDRVGKGGRLPYSCCCRRVVANELNSGA